MLGGHNGKGGRLGGAPRSGGMLSKSLSLGRPRQHTRKPTTGTHNGRPRKQCSGSQAEAHNKNNGKHTGKITTRKEEMVGKCVEKRLKRFSIFLNLKY